MEYINVKETSKNGNLKEVVNIVEQIINSNEEQNCWELKILTPKQILQGLPIAFGQVKAGDTSEKSLNEICQIIQSLYWAKEITKKVYNNIMNSVKL